MLQLYTHKFIRLHVIFTHMKRKPLYNRHTNKRPLSQSCVGLFSDKFEAGQPHAKQTSDMLCGDLCHNGARWT